MTVLWEDVLLAIQNRVPQTTYNRWFKPLTAQRLGEGELCLLAEDEFDAVFIERNFRELIRRHLSRLAGRDFQVSVTHRTGEAQPAGATPERPPATPSLETRGVLLRDPSPIQPAAPTPAEAILRCGLKLQYSFDSFVVGSSNEFAHAAARAVYSHPGQVYNPLFIFGHVGLGKTHLLNAVGIELLRSDPTRRVHYTTAETFMNRLIEHLQRKDMASFRAYYRDEVDALLIDDIQFLSGKEATQLEFFHTFNALHQAGKQIVITSDRYPHEISDLEERLRSRFQWGLIADIQAPTLETRLAILQRKAASLELELGDDVALLLANNIQRNVRELEGALLRLHAFVRFNQRPLTTDLAQQLLKQFFDDASRKLTVESIQREVCNYTHVGIADLKGRSRKRTLARARQIAMYLCKKLTGLSYPHLGEKFGGRDHTTVLAAHRRIKELMRTDPAVRDTVQHLESKLLR